MKANRWNLDLERANHAYNRVVEVNQNSEVTNSEYLSLARSAPTDVQFFGLAQVMAYWKQKAKLNEKSPHYLILSHVEGWLENSRIVRIEDGQRTLNWIMDTASTNQYRFATDEAVAYLSWIKRWSEAELFEKKGN